MSKDIVEVLRANLSYLLEKACITRRTLAQCANLSTTVVSFDNANYNPTVKTVQALADALHIDWQILFLDHDSETWRHFDQLSNLGFDFRRNIIIDPATHDIIPPCILSKEDIKACQDKERQYLKRLAEISDNLTNQNKESEQSKNIEHSKDREPNKDSEPDKNSEADKNCDADKNCEPNKDSEADKSSNQIKETEQTADQASEVQPEEKMA